VGLLKQTGRSQERVSEREQSCSPQFSAEKEAGSVTFVVVVQRKVRGCRKPVRYLGDFPVNHGRESWSMRPPNRPFNPLNLRNAFPRQERKIQLGRSCLLERTCRPSTTGG